MTAHTMCLVSFKYPLQTSMWLADLKQGVVPECLLGDVSGVLAGFTRESEIKPCAPG